MDLYCQWDAVIQWHHRSLVLSANVQLCTWVTTTGEGHTKVPADTGYLTYCTAFSWFQKQVLCLTILLVNSDTGRSRCWYQIIYYCTIFAMIIYLRVPEIGPIPVPVRPAPPIVD